ncbi:MAG TPA: autotransporter domain-containing protein [Pseudolabrys sp.]|nr:autotransporter domain-containing protein [Pseudolabrys sp.]
MQSRRGAAAALCAIASIAAWPGVARAQTFSRFFGFGDSTIDSGWYRSTPPLNTSPTFNTDFAAALGAGGGKATTNPGGVSAEYLAGKFGLTATPANTAGGTDYATGGARNNQLNTALTGGNTAAVPTVTQIGNYLAGNNGAADAGALYVISTGGNDITYAANQLAAADRSAYVTTAATDLVAAIARLQAAGARYIVIPNQPESFGTAELKSLRALYDSTVWSGLAARGVNFVPADFNAVIAAVIANPASFGFQFVSNTGAGPACTQPAGITSGWATMCSPTSPVSTLVSPDAASTHLFADDLHLTTAGQQIVADYEYSLLVAPSQISFLPEAQVKTRAAILDTIFSQIPISQRSNAPRGFNAWVSGDFSFLKMANANGFPDDPGTPAGATAGLSFKFGGDWIAGAAISAGSTTQSFSTMGSYRQDDVAGSLYAGYRHNRLWVNAAATFGMSRYKVDRPVQIGVTTQPNTGTTNGTNVSLAFETGYDLVSGKIEHGPVGGMRFQHIRVDGFIETGSFTSLSFGGQTRNSAVSQIGYQASYDAGKVRPFARAAWNHEWASTDRDVEASLTTTAAPSYTMPAVVLGKDWGTATLGVIAPAATNCMIMVALTGQFAQQSATAYGLQVGLNAAF